MYMYTDKSLKHIKSNDKLFIANVSSYFEKHSGRDSSSYSGKWGLHKNRFRSTKRTMRNPYTFVAQRPKRGQYKPLDDIDEVVIRNNVQEFYTNRHPLLTINNLLSALKTDIMSTIH